MRTRRERLLAAGLLACAAWAGAGGAQAPAGSPREIVVPGNPILADGEYYSTDPAPFVAEGRLWILAGRDMAADGVNDFIMPEWQLLETDDPAGDRWTHHPAAITPQGVFAWAEPARAYAAQIVPAPDGRFYLYAPVLERDSDAEDRFAIGVAVADHPEGPWHDAHPAGPIISQQVPVANTIQNIDPTVLVDDDGRVFIYWGTFGQLRGMELAADMVTPVGTPQTITGLTGFFEAPWIMQRGDTYYMLYAGNDAGPDSPCTPTLYHACIAYGTAPAPMGPWTWRGTVLGPVSSTTSHPGAVEIDGQWWLAYHTADAVGGGHFRRSVALDRLYWDDSVTPARILPVQPTRRPAPSPAPTRNVAPAAFATASNDPVPVQYWLRALNDGRIRAAPLPPDMWGSWTPENPPMQWIEYRWDQPVTLNGSRILFWNDQPDGSGVGVAPPAAWHLQYWQEDDAGGRWTRVPHGAPHLGEDSSQSVAFAPITTRCLRAMLTASTDGKNYAGLAVQEWEALAPAAAKPIWRDVDDTPPAPCSQAPGRKSISQEQ